MAFVTGITTALTPQTQKVITHFVAATLHGFLGGDVSQGISYGLRVSKYALTHHGDLTHITPSELAIPTTTDIIR